MDKLMRGKNIKKSPDQKKSDRGGQRQELSPSVLRRRMIRIRRRRYCRSIPLSLSQPDTTTIISLTQPETQIQGFQSLLHFRGTFIV